MFIFTLRNEVFDIMQRTQFRTQNIELTAGTREVMETGKTITPQAYGNHKDLGLV